MQLTKDDVKIYTDYETGKQIQVIDFSKFLKVRKLYEKYRDNKWGFLTDFKCAGDEKLDWRFHKPHIDYDDWLFNYCFKDGLK